MSIDRSRHVAALDGIRGLAVAGVIAFHSGYTWASGGFLGVSVFFTLSGYLITSRLLAEHRRDGAIDLRAFYRRRVARLLPAGLLGLLLAVLVGRSVGGGSAALRGDLLAALAQVANWRWLLSSSSYADLFSAPSPVLHYWSLAVEEQFYLAFPPVLVWALHRSEPRLRAFLIGGVTVSWLLLVGLVFADLRDAAYYATPTRLGEILLGALLGSLAAPAEVRRRFGHVAWLGTPALLALVVAVAVADSSTRWSYAVWLPVTSILSVLLIIGAAAGGALARALAWRPLAALGRISYGVYVFHWPVFLLLTPTRTGFSPTTLLLARGLVTVGLALVSYWLIEQPVLRAARSSQARPQTSALALTAWPVVLVAVVVGTAGVRPATDFAQVTADLHDERPAPIDGEMPRIAYFGDSTAAVTGLAVSGWGGPIDRVGVVGYEVPLGCGLELPGERRSRGKVIPIAAKCFESAARWPAEVSGSGARLAVVQSGAWEVTDHRFPGEEVWRALGDPELDAAYLERFLSAVDGLLHAGADRVVWITSPTLHFGRQDVNDADLPESAPARIDRYNELVREVARQRPQVLVLDLAAEVDGWSDAEDLERRPDGIHLTAEAAAAVVDTWLGPALLEVWASLDASDPARTVP